MKIELKVLNFMVYLTISMATLIILVTVNVISGFEFTDVKFLITLATTAVVSNTIFNIFKLEEKNEK